MRDQEFDQFAEAFGMAWTLYGKTASPGVLMLAFSALQDFDLSDITRALSAHVRDPDAGQYAPKPADIVRQLRGGKADQGQSAFDKAYRAACKIGPYQSVTFDDPLIHAVIADMGGWKQFCGWDIGEHEEKKPFMQQEFIRRYAHYSAHPPAQHLRQLTGIFDAENRQNGYLEHIKPPMLIGNQQAAERVYLSGGQTAAIEATRAMPVTHDEPKALSDGR